MPILPKLFKRSEQGQARSVYEMDRKRNVAGKAGSLDHAGSIPGLSLASALYIPTFLLTPENGREKEGAVIKSIYL